MALSKNTPVGARIRCVDNGLCQGALPRSELVIGKIYILQEWTFSRECVRVEGEVCQGYWRDRFERVEEEDGPVA